MQIHQILIRPEANTLIILYMDLAGRRNSIVLDAANDSVVQQLISTCQSKLPSDAENPAKDEVEQEISQLQDRLTQLKKSIGEPV